MPTATATINPYPGLRPFGRSDYEFFFGREREIDDLLGRLSACRFMAVMGVSGCGKSSLVHAGLIPILSSGLAEPLSGEWRIYSLWPGGDPLKHLQDAIGAELQSQSHALLSWAKKQNPNENILIFVDQFEEIFPYRNKTIDEDGGNKAALFIDLLITAVADPTIPLYVVLTMRTDYLGECAVFRGLSEALNDGSYLVPRLSRLRQQEAIVRPAAELGVKGQPGLVQRLLNDSEGDPDKLPVLQHILKVLWESRSHEFDLDLYEKIGGWLHTLENDAEGVLAQFPEEQVNICRMFQWLADPGTGGKPVRRRVPVAELRDVTGLSPERFKTILDAFADRGFIRLDSSNEGLVDFTHESVMWQWPKLQAWIEAEAEDAAQARFLQKSAEQKQWLIGLTLKNAQALRERAKSSPRWISRYLANPQELQELLDWIEASQQRQYDELAASQKQRDREKSRRRTLIGLISSLFLISTMAAISLFVNYDSAKKNYASTQAHNQVLARLNDQLNTQNSVLDKATGQLNAMLEQTKQDRSVSRSAVVAKEYLKQSAEGTKANWGGITIQYFAKQSELTGNPMLVPSWKQLGFNVQISKPNFEFPSNAIWFGSEVDRLPVQTIAYSLLTDGFALRQIRELDPVLNRGRERIIQVGWSGKADNLPLLTPSDVQKFNTKQF